MPGTGGEEYSWLLHNNLGKLRIPQRTTMRRLLARISERPRTLFIKTNGMLGGVCENKLPLSVAISVQHQRPRNPNTRVVISTSKHAMGPDYLSCVFAKLREPLTGGLRFHANEQCAHVSAEAHGLETCS